jgi:proline iminopeptidase
VRQPRHVVALRWFGLAMAAVLLALAASVAFTWYAYHRVPPADLPCRGCEAPARVARVNGYDLYYRELVGNPSRPPLVALHGGPGMSSLTFKGSFDRFAPDRRVVYYDQRGSGQSQIKPFVNDYTIEQLVSELEALRRDVIRADRIVVVGHSFGGALAQRYALAYPDRVSALVLVGSPRVNLGMSPRWLWKIIGPAAFSTALGLPPSEANEADRWFGSGPDNEEMRSRLFNKQRTDIFQGGGYSSFAPWLAISLSAAGPDRNEDLRRLRVPTLFAYGEADAAYTGRNVAEELCGLLPRCQAVKFTHSGHWPHLEEPDRFDRVVRAFLASLGL